jgi:hypothetical protein
LRTGWADRRPEDELGERLHLGFANDVPRPSRPSNAASNFLNPAISSNAPLLGCALTASRPPVRSPRQCIGPWLAMPRRLCVVIGPFIGWKSGLLGSPCRSGFWLSSTDASGLPRSQPRPSKSPKT